ncbi:7904_t:CDS:2 [Ambispora gerdemannii]|uniref:7904_t:CDS:1 n=1 Tax=Ambispora gerdemannii TaxID=144530 RepID=A0A9N9D5P9_9GLOM|nr:7904_t:CDS:2 [Ambispora gerdemannii]
MNSSSYLELRGASKGDARFTALAIIGLILLPIVPPIAIKPKRYLKCVHTISLCLSTRLDYFGINAQISNTALSDNDYLWDCIAKKVGVGFPLLL